MFCFLLPGTPVLETPSDHSLPSPIPLLSMPPAMSPCIGSERTAPFRAVPGMESIFWMEDVWRSQVNVATMPGASLANSCPWLHFHIRLLMTSAGGSSLRVTDSTGTRPKLCHMVLPRSTIFSLPRPCALASNG